MRRSQRTSVACAGAAGAAKPPACIAVRSLCAARRRREPLDGVSHQPMVKTTAAGACQGACCVPATSVACALSAAGANPVCKGVAKRLICCCWLSWDSGVAGVPKAGEADPAPVEPDSRPEPAPMLRLRVRRARRNLVRP